MSCLYCGGDSCGGSGGGPDMCEDKKSENGPMVKWQRRLPFKQELRVRFSLGLPYVKKA